VCEFHAFLRNNRDWQDQGLMGNLENENSYLCYDSLETIITQIILSFNKDKNIRYLIIVLNVNFELNRRIVRRECSNYNTEI
jgi:hypothetical protein